MASIAWFVTTIWALLAESSARSAKQSAATGHAVPRHSRPPTLI